MNLQIPNWLDDFKQVPGAFSVAETLALYNAVKDHYTLKELNSVEVGSNIGKSSTSAAIALNELGVQTTFFMIDPIFYPINERRWPWCADPEMEYKVNKRMSSIAPNLKIHTSGEYSTQFFNQIKEPFGYIMVDSGDHGPELLAEEIPFLKSLSVPGTILFFHDWNCQFSAVNEAYIHLVNTGEWVEIDMYYDEIAKFVEDNRLEDGNDSWHGGFDRYSPIFVGGLKKIKKEELHD